MELTIIYVIIVLLLGLFSNNKAINLLLIITLYLLFAFEHSDQDYLAYVNAYDAVGSGSILELWGYEPSFFLFCTLGNKFGLSFDIARAIICVFEVIAIGTTIKVFTNRVACVIALFLIFPATADAELFRWLAGMCVVIFGFPYIIRGESKRDYIIYSVYVILATTLHTSCIFFLLYNLLYIRDRRKLTIVVFSVFAVLFATAQVRLVYKLLAYLPIQDTLTDKFQQTGQSNIFGIVALSIRELFIFCLGYFVYKKSRNSASTKVLLDGSFSIKRTKYSQNEMSILLFKKIWSINIISVLLIAIARYTPQVQRLFHILLFMNCIAAVYLYSESKKKSILNVTLLCCVMTLLLHINNGELNKAIFFSHFNEGFLVNFIKTCGLI